MDIEACIERELVLSTAHIGPADVIRLDEAVKDDSNLAVRDQEYGWTVQFKTNAPTTATIERIRAAGSSEAIIKLLRLAHSNRCVRLRLDRNADKVDGLPTFPW